MTDREVGEMNFEGGGGGPGAKQCGWSLKAGKDKESDTPTGGSRRTSPANTSFFNSLGFMLDF